MTKEELSLLTPEQIKAKAVWTGEELLLYGELMVQRYGEKKFEEIALNKKLKK